MTDASSSISTWGARSTTKSGRQTDAVSLVAGLAALAAPASLTGYPYVDAIERFLIAVVVTYTGAHSRRWAWLVAGVGVVLGARGASLVVALAGLAVLVVETWPKRRSRVGGAIGIGIIVNAAFWYPPESPPWGVATAAIGLATVAFCGLRFVRRPRRRAIWAGIGVAGSFAVVATVAFAVSMALSYNHVNRGADAAKQALGSARDGDADATQVALTEARSSFDEASSLVGGPLGLPARFVPGLSQQARAIRVTVNQGVRVSDTADELASTADYESLQYDDGLDLTQVDALREPTAEADRALQRADDKLRSVLDSSLLPPLRDRVEEFSGEIEEARADTALARELLAVTPRLFGANGDRRYLVVFQTPAELRGSGGFIGSFAELTARQGQVELTRSGRISELINARPRGERTLDGPKDYLARYGRFQPQDFLQDTSFSPHFPSSADVIAQLYAQSGGAPVDGVIGVDPTGMAALLELTGPVQVPGLDGELNADNAVEILTRSQYLDYPEDAERNDILAEATKVTFEKLLDTALPSPRKLSRVLSPAARSGHLRLWSPDDVEQAVFERVGADGSLVLPKGDDGFSVVQQNSGNNKLDAYLQRSITYDATVDAASGALRSSMRIELHNGVPSLDLPPAVVDNNRAAPVGTNVAWLTIYTRSNVTGASIDGTEVSLGPSTEQGLNAFDTPLIQIPPGATVVLEVELEGALDLSDGTYGLAILPQPVANPDRFTATVRIERGVDAATGEHEANLVDDQALTAPSRYRVEIER